MGDFCILGLSTDLCAISDHAMARTFASGYRKWGVGNSPPVSFWSTVTMLEPKMCGAARPRVAGRPGPRKTRRRY